MSIAVGPTRNLLAEQYPHPLHVAIVGSGIGALSAAIALRRQGHRVELYGQQQPSHPGEEDGVVNLGPNANGLIRSWGLLAEAFGGCEMQRIAELDSSGNVTRTQELSISNRKWKHPWHLVPSVRLSERLRGAAKAQDGPGIPATVHAAAEIVSVDCEAGHLVLVDGTLVSADVLVGADGASSRTRESTLGDGGLKPSIVGETTISFSVSRAAASDDAVTRPLLDRHCTLTTWNGGNQKVDLYDLDGDARLYIDVVYTGAAVAHPPPESGSNAQVLALLQGYDPTLLRLVEKADVAELQVRQRLGVDNLASWVKGKLALLGDAAHPLVCPQGQSAAQAIEDAMALATVLAAGTAPEHVPDRLRLYEEIRRGRMHRLQESSRQGEDAVHADANFGFDEGDHSAAVFSAWLWSQRPPAIHRMPIAFGPCPGPRQDGFGRPHGGHHERTFMKASIMFKTSRTYLQSLLPPTQSFRFRSRPGSVAFASLFITTVGNMSWLGGGGYTHCGLYVHDVEYVKRDGAVVYGTYLPVMFENLADPIISGRDELGMNKVFCDITIDSEAGGDSYGAGFSWRGAEFFRARLDGLQPAAAPLTEELPADAAEDYGLLTYKYIPATGEPGKADIEYACVIPHAEEAKIARPTVHSLLWSHRPHVEFAAGDWARLPTLHHITAALAAMPIYSYVFAKVERGLGVADMSSCRRIE